MKKIYPIVFVVALSVLLASGCTTTSGDQEEIKNVIETFKQGYNSENIEMLKSVLVHDMVGDSFPKSAVYPFKDMELNSENMQAFKYLMWYNQINKIEYISISLISNDAAQVKSVINDEDDNYAYTIFNLFKIGEKWKIDTIVKEDSPSFRNLSIEQKTDIILKRREIQSY